MLRMRRILGLLVAGVLLVGTAGCSVIVNGVTGITVDQAGNLLVTLAWCGRQPDHVFIYHLPEPSRSVSNPSESTAPTADPRVTVARYLAPKILEGKTSFRIEEPTNGWSIDFKPSAFDPEITYYAAGATKDNSASTGKVRFRLGQVDELKRRPGMVLVYPGDKEKPDEFITQAEFDRRGKVESCID